MQKIDVCEMECICRICLSNRESPSDMVDIFDPIADTVANIYTMFTSLPAESSDGLSKYICGGCHKSIVGFQKFRELCIGSYNFLCERRLIKQDIVHMEDEHGDPEYDDFNCDDFKCESPDVNSEPDVVNEPDFNEEVKPKAESCSVQKVKGVKSVKAAKSAKGKRKPTSKGPTDNTKMYCDICQKAFRRKFLLEGHMRVHMGLKPFQCEICENKQFISITNYNEHMNSKHNANREKKIFKCDYEGCDKTYHISDSLRSHINIKHLGRPQKPTTRKYTCELCGKSFKSITSLNTHKYVHLPNLKPFKCKYCSKKFATKPSLKLHTQRHEGIRKHVCTICNMRTSTPGELRVHMNYHTKEKQFPCEVCGKVFNSIGNRTSHNNIVHLGIKKFKCNLCEMSFGKADGLKHHMMTHTGEKPLACTMCDKRFIQPTALNTHMKTHLKTHYSR